MVKGGLSVILISHKFKPIFRVIGLTTFLLFSCEEANYELDNPFDPENMDLDPPALFFHPPEINATVGDPISVELYGLKLGSRGWIVDQSCHRVRKY